MPDPETSIIKLNIAGNGGATRSADVQRAMYLTQELFARDPVVAVQEIGQQDDVVPAAEMACEAQRA